ncbi:MAG: periplasmic chaperone for outer membrane protein Skp [Verrucomicrobiota bacterium]|jgi:outer membrane protein
MNRTALTLAAALTASLLSTTALAQGKVGVINLTKVFDDFWRTKQADGQIKERLAEFEKMGQSMYDDYKKANEEFGKQIEAANDPALSKEESEKRRKDLDKKRKDIMEMETNIKQFQGNSQRALMEQRGRVRESILRDVRGVLEEKAKAGGYATVLDVSALSANGTPVVIFTTLTGGESDLSDSVAKTLAATAPPETSKSEAPKSESKDPKKADDKKPEKK